MTDLPSRAPDVVYGGERRIVLHREPRQMGPEVVDISDDGSDEAPVGV